MAMWYAAFEWAFDDDCIGLATTTLHVVRAVSCAGVEVIDVRIIAQCGKTRLTSTSRSRRGSRYGWLITGLIPVNIKYYSLV